MKRFSTLFVALFAMAMLTACGTDSPTAPPSPTPNPEPVTLVPAPGFTVQEQSSTNSGGVVRTAITNITPSVNSSVGAGQQIVVELSFSGAPGTDLWVGVGLEAPPGTPETPCYSSFVCGDNYMLGAVQARSSQSFGVNFVLEDGMPIPENVMTVFWNGPPSENPDPIRVVREPTGWHD